MIGKEVCSRHLNSNVQTAGVIFTMTNTRLTTIILRENQICLIFYQSWSHILKTPGMFRLISLSRGCFSVGDCGLLQNLNQFVLQYETTFTKGNKLKVAATKIADEYLSYHKTQVEVWSLTCICCPIFKALHVLHLGYIPTCGEVRLT